LLFSAAPRDLASGTSAWGVLPRFSNFVDVRLTEHQVSLLKKSIATESKQKIVKQSQKHPNKFNFLTKINRIVALTSPFKRCTSDFCFEKKHFDDDERGQQKQQCLEGGQEEKHAKRARAMKGPKPSRRTVSKRAGLNSAAAPRRKCPGKDNKRFDSTDHDMH
jgi:hypothetical protein